MNAKHLKGKVILSPETNMEHQLADELMKRALTKSSFPSHYCDGRIEQIDIQASLMTHEELRGALWGNIIRYICRWKFKGTPIDDLKKAKTYLDWLIQHEEREDK